MCLSCPAPIQSCTYKLKDMSVCGRSAASDAFPFLTATHQRSHLFLFRLLRDFNSWTKKDYPVILIKAGLQAQIFCLMIMIISQESHVVFNQTPAVVGHIHGKWEYVNETPDPVQTETL